MEEFSLHLITIYGPLALGWIAAILLGWRIVAETKIHREDFQALIKDYHEAMEGHRVATIENTKATERLTTLLDERTRNRNGSR